LKDSKPLTELERLKFKFEGVDIIPKLEELNIPIKVDNLEETTLTDEVKNHNGVELPPIIPKEIEEEVIEKEEV
jgi:glutaredoxin-related protein